MKSVQDGITAFIDFNQLYAVSVSGERCLSCSHVELETEAAQCLSDCYARIDCTD